MDFSRMLEESNSQNQDDVQALRLDLESFEQQNGNADGILYDENDMISATSSGEAVLVADQDHPPQVESSSQELFMDSQAFTEDDNVFSQGTLDFITGAIEGGGEFPQSLDNSYNFSGLENDDQLLNQAEGIEEHEFSCSQVDVLPLTQNDPTLSEASDENEEQEEQLWSFQVGVVGTEEFNEETGYFGQGSAQTSSQDSSQGDGLPAITDYPGKYNFSVTPVQHNGKKWLLDSVAGRIYCPKNTEILFSFALDFSIAPLKNLTIEAMLVFSSNTFMNTAVPRCTICYDEEALTSVDANICRHVLRCSHPRAKYNQNERSERWYVSVPLEKPQLGEDSILRNYKFTCLNSCKHGGINRRDTAVMFLLKEGTKQVGRSCYHVKVCTGPSRDYQKDVKKHDEGENKMRKRKGCASTTSGDEAGTSEQVDEERGAKYGRSVENEPEALDGTTQTTVDSETASAPGPSRPRTRIEEQDSEEFFNSQEELSANFVEHLHSNVKLALVQRNSADPKHRQITAAAVNQLKVFQKNMDYYRTYIHEPEEKPIKEETEDPADNQ